MINSRNIQDLEINFRMKAMQWRDACALAGLEVLVISTYRDDEYQNWLYASGRTREGKVVTNARGGESLHNKRLAFDFCIMDGKRCNWTDKERYKKAGEIAEALGLEWAGRWTGKLKELGHIQQKK